MKTPQLKGDCPFADEELEIPDEFTVSTHELYNRIKRTLNNSKQYERYPLWDADGIQLLSIVPTSVLEKLENDKNYLYHFFYEEIIYSLIFGYFIIVDSDREFNFYGSPQLLLECYKSFAIKHECTYGFLIECHEIPWISASILSSNLNLINYLRDKLNISSIIVKCHNCGIALAEHSAEEIIIANPNIELASTPDSIHCPICSNTIALNKHESDLISSIPVYYFYNYLNSANHYNIPTPMKRVVSEGLHDNNFLRINSKLFDCICIEYFKLSSQDLFNVVKCFPDIFYGISEPTNDDYDEVYSKMDIKEIIQAANILIRNSKIEKLRESILHHQVYR